MVSINLDITAEFNSNSGYVQDMSGWDYAVVQLVSPSGAVTFQSTNDGGSLQSGSYSNSISATNFIDTQGTNLNSGAAVTSLNASGLVRFNVVGQYLKLTGSSVTATKVLIRLAKIH